MTLEELRLYISPTVYCMVIDVSGCDSDNGKEIFKGRCEKMIRYYDELKPEKYLIWSMTVDKLRGWLVIRVYKKGLFKSN